VSNKPSRPVLDGTAPPWAQAYDADLRAYIETLKAEIEALKARLKAANIA
jgi:hypothetical protein